MTLSLASEEGVTTGAVAVGANGQNITYDQHEGKIYNFKLASFPEDEQILNQLKVYQTSAAEYAKIKYADGTNVAASDLVPDNFTIVWYIFKLGEGEGAWHIDGNLIPKSSYLKITKSFSGDEDVVGQMENKDKYSLTLKDDTTHTIGNKEYSFEKQLVLSDNSEQNPPVDEITLGDPAHVTETISAAKVENADGSYSYTWTIPVHSFENYTITENNYDYYVVYPPNDPSSLNNVVTLAQFNVTNTTTVNGKDTVTDVNQLTTYTDSGVKIYTQPYLDSQGTKSFQTVNFRNSYFRTTDLEINKVDATSGNVLAGAQFKLSKIDSDGNEVETHFYSNVSANKNTLYIYPAAVTGTSELINNTFTIGEGVSVILKNFRDSEYTGTYTLEEIEAPTGYTKLGEKIRIEIDSRGNIVNAEDSDLIEWVCIPIDDDDDLVSAIRIKNKPELVDILIKKKWDSNCKDEAVNITYDLFQNGVRLTSNLQKPEDDKDPTSKSPVTVTEYGSKVIDYQSGSPKVTNEKAGIWTAIWKNLPKYINGRLVDYEVVETTITDSSGTHNHDEKADKEDGYRNYIVKYLYPKNGATDTTYDSNNNPINGKFEITITNKKDTGEQLLKLDATKTDQESRVLAGAVFQIIKYSDPYFNTPEGLVSDGELGGTDFTSSTDGTIKLPLLDEGYYRLQEIKAPAGYNLPTTAFDFYIHHPGDATGQNKS